MAGAVRLTFALLGRTGAHRQGRPRYFRLAFACSRTHFFVSSNQRSLNAIKKRPVKGRLFMAGAVRLTFAFFYKKARPHRRALPEGKRRSSARLALVVELTLVVSSHQRSLNAIKKRPVKGRLFMAGAVRTAAIFFITNCFYFIIFLKISIF